MKLDKSCETKTVEIKFYPSGDCNDYLVFINGNLQWFGVTYEELVETIDYAKEYEFLNDSDDFLFPNGTNIMSLLS